MSVNLKDTLNEFVTANDERRKHSGLYMNELSDVLEMYLKNERNLASRPPPTPSPSAMMAFGHMVVSARGYTMIW